MIFNLCAQVLNFNFLSNSKTPGASWSFYGEGTGLEDSSGLKLSCDFNETETSFFEWNNLSPGFYKVTTFVKAQDVQKGVDGASFWHFYDGGEGTISPFTDLSGSYDWRKVEYTLKVKDKKLTVWFRLKSPGTVWIKEFSLKKIDKADQIISIAPASELPETPVTFNKGSTAIASKKKLYNFESSESGHPFSVKKDISKNSVGEFAPQKFYNFDLSKMPIKDWSAFDRIEMDVYNPNQNYSDFFLTLADDQTTNYWSQVNHKQALAPGWNSLSFSLEQYLGERGSHRFLRPINLAKLRKVFIVIDPDSKSTFNSKSFFIDNITLSKNPFQAPPTGVMAFDFTSHKAAVTNGWTPVTTQTLFNAKRGYGFIDPKFWRVEDSKYTSEVLRYSIGILDGHFQVKVPNGKYQVSLILDKLGFWDVPFWSDRTVSINGKVLFKESRSSGSEFLNDLLQFENVNPTEADHPYDLYLAKYFRPIERSVEVTNGRIDFEFNGDQSGISLNSLIIWNKNNEAAGKSYQEAFNKRNKLEFDWMARPIKKAIKKDSSNEALSISIIEPDLYLSPSEVRKSKSSKLSFFGGAGEHPYQAIQFHSGSGGEKISWNIGDLKNEQGVELPKNSLKINEIIYQYTSPDINHESYLITGKYLKEMIDHSLVLKKNQNHYLWLELKVDSATPVGLYKTDLSLHQGENTTKFPIEIEIMPYALPKLDFPVGFFGLDPLPYSYFKGHGYEDIRKKYRNRALTKLSEAGFSTFSALPEVQLKINGNDLSLGDIDELDDLLKSAYKSGFNQSVYSYGGQFPQSLLDLSQKPGDMSEDVYFTKIAKLVNPLLAKKTWPKIVHTFSDEASGYSDKVGSDIVLAKKLQKYFPNLALGGFGSFNGSDSKTLNSYFQYGFYSSLTKADISSLKNHSQKWGFYNASAGNLDDPRYSFGLGLFIARAEGLSQYLEWNSIGFNNYPYYDFDGRESDVAIFYPARDGNLYPTLRFEFSTEGLDLFRKLLLLDTAISEGKGSRIDNKSAKDWLLSARRENSFYSTTTPMSLKTNNFRELSNQLNGHLAKLYAHK